MKKIDYKTAYETTAKEQEIIINNLRKEIERLGYELQVQIEDNVRLNEYLKEQESRIERLNNVIKDIKSQLDYLETYSSKEDVFEDMKRRLDRIDKIIGSDKE